MKSQSQIQNQKKVSLKICGITNLEDAKLCFNLGADALGFIFVKSSPRFIAFKKYQDFAQRLPKLSQKVAVFQDFGLKELINFVNQLKPESSFDFIQLHGQEDSEYIKELRSKTRSKIIKSYRLKNSAENLKTFEEVRALDLSLVSVLMIDAKEEALNNQEISNFLELFYRSGEASRGELLWALAGKLNSENIKEQIIQYQPDLVDLCSSLEKEPGKKDPFKLEEFFDSFRNSCKE